MSNLLNRSSLPRALSDIRANKVSWCETCECMTPTQPLAVRNFYEQAYRDCRLVYNNLPSPRQIQTLVQVWKQLWKWR